VRLTDFPAFPMDGQSFSGATAERMKFSDATKLAVKYRQSFRIIMVIFGFLFIFLLILVGMFFLVRDRQLSENLDQKELARANNKRSA